MFEGNVGDGFLVGGSTPSAAVPTPPEELLHARCGVYTQQGPAGRILDAVGWTADADLRDARLLEPAAGDGAFVLAAADRLLAAFALVGLPLSVDGLSPRITAFELLEREAETARRSAAARLVTAGLSGRDARTVADAWIRTGDFLLNPPTTTFTHVVGNPPYCRWSRIPPTLKRAYEGALAPDVARGDIFLPFLDLGIELLDEGGVLGFICSDRWKYMGFAQGFRTRRLPQIEIVRDKAINADDAFVRSVDAYSSELVIRRNAAETEAPKRRRKPTRTLDDAGYRIRVGPALGCTPAYVVPNEADGIEPELLTPWVDGRDVSAGGLRAASRQVLTMNGADGQLIDLADFPGAERHLETYRAILSSRAVVRVSGKAWYAPIDRVHAADWARPKLLVPELAREPRVCLDLTGAIPSHGVYAVFAPDDDLGPLLAAWSDGGLGRALKGKAPMVKGGYVRCYKRFLAALAAPR